MLGITILLSFDHNSKRANCPVKQKAIFNGSLFFDVDPVLAV